MRQLQSRRLTRGMTSLQSVLNKPGFCNLVAALWGALRGMWGVTRVGLPCALAPDYAAQ